MTAPVIRQFVGTIPDKGQAQTAFDTNVDAFLDWQALQFAPDLVAFGVFAQTAANALLADNLPSLTGQSLKAVRVNAAADGIEMQTVTAQGWALLDDVNAAAQRTTLGAAALASPTFTGVPAAPTAAAATNTTQLATTEFVTAAVTAKGVQGGTIAATTSGTTFDFTSIPAAVQEVKILFNSVSLTGGDSILIQIGDGANRTTGYVATSASTTGTAGSNTNSTSGFPINGNEALSGVATLTRLGAGSNIWVFDSTARRTTTEMVISGGVKTLSGELDRVRITRTGTNTFDLGSVNVVWR